MRFTKRFLAFTLVAMMLLSTCLIGNATLPSTPTSTVSGVSFYEYKNTGASSGISATYDVLKFNVADGVIPMAYTGSAGKAMLVGDHVAAAQAEGYEVLGAINASFFEMSSEDPCSSLISDGRLMFTTSFRPDVFTAFTVDGTPNLIQTALRYTLTLGGSIITDGIGLVNKDYAAVNDVDATISTRFHYYDSVAGAIGNSAQKGYEVLCEKLDNTDISVGNPLKGKVISVTSGYYGKTIPTSKNQFVLFVKSSSSSYAGYATSLSAGDSVELSIEAYYWDDKGTSDESDDTYGSYDSWSTNILKNAHSAICDTYWLVYNGNNIAATSSSIGHSTTYSRPWTAFGWDDNGNYYYIITEGEKATLRDIAYEMVAMGATNVVRLDGGGSTAMYVNGKGMVYNQGRAVVDVLLIVKTPADVALEQTLAEAKALYVGDYSAEANAYLSKAYDSAYAVFVNPDSDNAAYKTANTNLQNAIAYVKNANNFADKTKISESDFLFASAVNEKVATGYASVFTTAYNGGTITRAQAGFGWCYNLICKSLGNDQYEVVEQINRPGTAAADIVLEEGQILVSVNKSAKVTGSTLNAETAQRCVAGTVLTFKGFDLNNSYVSAGSYILCDIPVTDDGGENGGNGEGGEGGGNTDKTVLGLRGDVTKNGEIDSRDYVFLKRAYFGTYKLDETAKLLADVTNNGEIDSRDYVFLKRAYFGTYQIPEDIKYVYAE